VSIPDGPDLGVNGAGKTFEHCPLRRQ
jgi:hypothetical protein